MGYRMSGFIAGTCRTQATLFPDRLDDYIAEENTIRVIDVFVDSLDLSTLGLNRLGLIFKFFFQLHVKSDSI